MQSVLVVLETFWTLCYDWENVSGLTCIKESPTVNAEMAFYLCFCTVGVDTRIDEETCDRREYFVHNGFFLWFQESAFLS